MGLFSKEACAICGKEVGALSRTKIQNKEFICNDCDDGCSSFIDLYKLTKDEVVAHIEYMSKFQKLYDEEFIGVVGSNCTYPSNPRDSGIIFADKIGMFRIVTSGAGGRKIPEIFRFDHVAKYEPFIDYVPGNDKEIKEAGVVLSFLNSRDTMFGSNNKGLRPHPFVDKDIKIVLMKSPREKEIATLENMLDHVIGHFNHVFGVNDAKKALIQIGLTKDEKRKVQAGTDMLKGGIAMIKAAKAQQAGEEVDEEAIKEQLQQAADSAQDAQTSGLAVYSRAADEAEARAWGAPATS